jgi:hypothetical protein
VHSIDDEGMGKERENNKKEPRASWLEIIAYVIHKYHCPTL